MNDQHISRLELFATNTQMMKKNFVWHSSLLKQLAALLYAVQDKEVDCDKIHESYDLIKRSTGLFSAFRGNSAMSIATLLSLSDKRDTLLSETLAVYDMMKEARFKSSDFLVVAAYQIAANAKPYEYPQVIEKAKAYYDGIKAEHYFLTGQDDYIFASMLGLSDIDIETGLARMKKLYDILKPNFLSGNGAQALTQVLVLGNESSEAATRVLALRDALKERDFRLDRAYTLSSLGVLSLLPSDIDFIVNDVTETYKFLRKKEGFSNWSITKQELLLLSVSLVAFNYVDDLKSGILTATISTSITNIIIAQQAAIAAAAASSAAAASAASS